MARKKKPEMEVLSETGVTEITEPFLDEAPAPALQEEHPDPLASDADVCECHHARGRHRGGKDDCEGNGEPCDTKCTFFLLALGAVADAAAEPEASGETPAAEEPRPEPVAVADSELYPKAPADLDPRTCSRTLERKTVKLDNEELADLALEMADASSALNDHVEHSASVRKSLKEQETRLQGTLDRLVERVKTCSKEIITEAFEVPNAKERRIEIYDLDTRAFIRSRPMSDSEHESAVQGNLFGDATPSADSETPIGTNTMPTTPIPIEAECAECGHAQEHHGKDHRPDGCIVDGCPCRGFVALVVPEPPPPAEEPTPEEVAEASEDSEEAEEGAKAA